MAAITPGVPWTGSDVDQQTLDARTDREEQAAEGGGTSLGVKEEGSTVVAAASALNFAGASVTVTDGGSGVAVITITDATLTQEQVEDFVGALTTDGSVMDFTYTDNGAGAGTITVTIKAGAVANSMLADMTQGTAKGRAAGAGTGAPSDLTGAQLAAIAAGEVFKQAQEVNAQTGTTYTLVAGDAGKLVTLSNASAITLTLPQDSDATIAVGTYIDLMQLGAGQVTVAAGTGATLRTSGLTAKARAQYSRLAVQKVSANTWSLMGDLAAS